MAKDFLKDLDVLNEQKNQAIGWYDRLNAEQKKEMLEIRQAYQSGRWSMPAIQICKYAITRYSLKVTPNSVRRWLKGGE